MMKVIFFLLLNINACILLGRKDENMEILKVSSKSKPINVAGALASILKEKNEVSVQVIGAGSLNQLVKSIIICKGILAPLGKNIICIPSFTNVEIDKEEKTAIRMNIICQQN